MNQEWWNWPNNLIIDWPSDVMDFSGNHLVWVLVPIVALLLLLLFTILFGKKVYPRISKRAKGITYTSMGIFVIGWELWFDAASVASGVNALEQFKDGFDLCRLNMYILGSFLLFRKINWVKWIVATCLFGGLSTMVDHYGPYAAPATIHSLITHGIILSVFPSFVVAISGENYLVRNYLHAHIFNLLIVTFLIVTNILWDKSAGELSVEALDDNVLVGWAPGVWAMVMWIFAVMFVELCYFLVHRSIYWYIYQKSTSLSWIGAFKEEWPKDKEECYGFRLNDAKINDFMSASIRLFNKCTFNIFVREKSKSKGRG